MHRYQPDARAMGDGLGFFRWIMMAENARSGGSGERRCVCARGLGTGGRGGGRGRGGQRFQHLHDMQTRSADHRSWEVGGTDCDHMKQRTDGEREGQRGDRRDEIEARGRVEAGSREGEDGGSNREEEAGEREEGGGGREGTGTENRGTRMRSGGGGVGMREEGAKGEGWERGGEGSGRGRGGEGEKGEGGG